MIHLDTSFLVRALISGSASEGRMLSWLNAGEQIGISSISWSEFLCGPLTAQERAFASILFPAPEAFLCADAEKAAELFNLTGRRSRSLADCQIAAVALRLNAAIATENVADFKPFSRFALTIA